MEDIQIIWKKIYDNCESNTNIVIDDNNNIVFYYNTYEDDTIHERKKGHLVCLSEDGEENWVFSFPEYSYLYFTGNIIFNGQNYYVAVDGSREFDNGFTRGIYMFNLFGQFIVNYSYLEALEEIKSVQNVQIKTSQSKKENIQKILRTSILAFEEKNNKKISIINRKNGLEIYCIN